MNLIISSSNKSLYILSKTINMSHKKLENHIFNFISKLNELKGFIQINSERNDNFKNYLKTSEYRENELKIYLSESMCDLKVLYEIEYNQYSSVEFLKGNN